MQPWLVPVFAVGPYLQLCFLRETRSTEGAVCLLGAVDVYHFGAEMLGVEGYLVVPPLLPFPKHVTFARGGVSYQAALDDRVLWARTVSGVKFPTSKLTRASPPRASFPGHCWQG